MHSKVYQPKSVFCFLLMITYSRSQILLTELLLTLFVMGSGTHSAPTPLSSPVNFFYHINFNNTINLIFSDFRFYRFINILAKFGCSGPGQFGGRTFLSKNFLKFFVLWPLKFFFLFIVCISVFTTWKSFVLSFFVIYSKIDYFIWKFICISIISGLQNSQI